MDPIRAVIAMVTSCSAAVSPVVSAMTDPAHAPAEEYVYAVDGVVCTAMQCMIDDDLGITMCCVRAIHATFPYGRTTKKAKPPAGLTSTEVKTGLAAVRGRIDGCGDDRYGGRGEPLSIRVRAVITPEGAMTDVIVVPPADDGPARDLVYERCVVTAMTHARFPRSEAGATFTYPIRRR